MKDLDCLLDKEQLLPSEMTRRFADFLVKHHLPEIESILMEFDDADSAHYSVSVNVIDLLQEDLAIGTLLLHHPDKTGDPSSQKASLLELLDQALVVAQEEVVEHHEDANFMSVKHSAHARPHHLPRCRELWKETVSSIRATNINSLLSVSGTVIRTGQIKMLQSKREYRCVKCDHTFQLEADIEQRHQMPIPPECPSQLNAKRCHGTKFEVVEGSEVCKDYQEARAPARPPRAPPFAGRGPSRARARSPRGSTLRTHSSRRRAAAMPRRLLPLPARRCASRSRCIG